MTFVDARCQRRVYRLNSDCHRRAGRSPLPVFLRRTLCKSLVGSWRYIIQGKRAAGKFFIKFFSILRFKSLTHYLPPRRQSPPNPRFRIWNLVSDICSGTLFGSNPPRSLVPRSRSGSFVDWQLLPVTNIGVTS